MTLAGQLAEFCHYYGERSTVNGQEASARYVQSRCGEEIHRHRKIEGSVN